MSTLPPTIFDVLMQQIRGLPLWIKQVIYTMLRQDLEATLSKQTLEAFGPEHTLQLWEPELTRRGQSELEDPAPSTSANLRRVLQLARYQKNVLTITVLNQWTLEQSSRLLLEAIDQDLIAPPRSSVVKSTMDYLAGRTRLGEYLVKINRLTLERLDQALRTQKAIEDAMGEKTGIANVLINLGYIKKEDSEAILFLKEESKKLFHWTYTPATMGGGVAMGGESPQQVAQLQAQLQQAMQRIRELEAR